MHEFFAFVTTVKCNLAIKLCLVMIPRLHLYGTRGNSKLTELDLQLHFH